nr:phospholipase-like protein [Tanacetum cinerariifolium]
MWHVRPNDPNWAMVSSYFLQLLLQNAMPLWYANGERYYIAWTEADKVYIPINEPGQHFILFGVVTFYDNGDSYDLECRDWYIRTRDCLQVRLPKLLEILNVLDKKAIDKSTYQITFSIVENCALDHFSNPVASNFLYASGLSALMPKIDFSNSGTM